MTSPNLDLGALVEELSNRIHKLEMKITSPNYTVPNGSSPTFGEVTIGTPGEPPEAVLALDPEPPTALVYSTQAQYNDVSVTVEWTASPDLATASYNVSWLLKNVGDNNYVSVGSFRTGGTSHTLTNAIPGRTYRAEVTSISTIGAAGDPLTDAQFIVAATDATIPGALTGFMVVAGATSLTAMWNDSDDPDVKAVGLYQIQVSDDNLFDNPLVYDQYTTASIVSFTGLTGGEDYWLRIRPVDASGNNGPWTGPIQATPSTAGGVFTGPVTQEMLDPGIIADEHIVTAGLSAATIKFGTMSGDRIQANTLDVNSLKTSTLTAKTITLGSGGLFTSAAGAGTRFDLDSAGFRLYKASTLMVDINAVTGDAYFKGTIASGSVIAASISGGNISGGTITGVSISGVSIDGGTITGATVQTAYSGQRVVLPAGLSRPTMRMYTGFPEESGPALIEAEQTGSGFGARNFVNIRTADFSSGGYGWGGQYISIRSSSQSAAGSIVLQAHAGTIELRAYTVMVYGDMFNGNTGYAYSMSDHTHSAYASSSHNHSGVYATSGHTHSYADASHTHSYAPLSHTSGIHSDSTVRAVDNTADGCTFGYRSSDARYRAYINGSSGLGFAAPAGALLKSFVIDHPTQPDDYLVHGCIEGPEAAVYYRGRVRTTDGQAWVQLPDYFEDLTLLEGRTVTLTQEYNETDWTSMLSASYPIDGQFLVYALGGNIGMRECGRPDCTDDCPPGEVTVHWRVEALRKDIPQPIIEPSKNKYVLHGDGPYTYLTPTP